MEKQIELMGYTTKNFDICTEAVEAFGILIEEKMVDMDTETIDNVFSALQYQDAIFGIKKSGKKNKEAIKEILDLYNLSSYSLGLVAEVLDEDMDSFFSYLQELLADFIVPEEIVSTKNMGVETMGQYGDTELSMAYLRKLAIQVPDLLSMIDKEDMDQWVGSAICCMGREFDPVYTYYKFNEVLETPEEESQEIEELLPTMEEMMSGTQLVSLAAKHKTLGQCVAVPTLMGKTYNIAFPTGLANNVPEEDLIFLDK